MDKLTLKNCFLEWKNTLKFWLNQEECKILMKLLDKDNSGLLLTEEFEESIN